MDLLVVLTSSNIQIRDRIPEFLKDCSAYPTDVFPLTESELETELAEPNPFWVRALKEGIECYPAAE